MNLFNSIVGKVIIEQNAYIEVKDKKAIVVQVDSTGIFKEVVEFDIDDGKYVVDKRQFLKAISIIKDPVFKVNKTNITVSDKETTIKVSFVEADFFEVSDSKKEFIDLPKGFIEIFNKASNFTGENHIEMVMNSVHITKDSISSTNGFILYLSKLENGIDIECNVPKDTFKNFKGAETYAYEDNRLFISNKDLSKMFIPKLIEGRFPNINKAIEKFSGSPKLTLSKDTLLSKIATAKNIGHVVVVITPDYIEAKSKGISEYKSILKSGVSRQQFNIDMLSKIKIVSGDLYNKMSALVIKNEIESVIVMGQVENISLNK